MSKHTPGPWKVSPSTYENGTEMKVFGPKGNTMFVMVGGDPANRADNARLIAAAPEMLAVIKMLILHSPKDCEDYGVPEAYALLARVEGEDNA